MSKARTKRKTKQQAKRKPVGMAPGSLVFTGERQVAESHVTLLQYNAEEIHKMMTKDALPAEVEMEGIAWYDVRGLHNVDLIEALGRRFNMHQLALEDVLNVRQRPKFEEYPGGLFLIARAMTFKPHTLELCLEQVSIYAADGLVISFQEDEDDLFLPIRERLEAGRGRIRRRNPDYLAYALLDAVVDNYFIIIDQIEEIMDRMEADILKTPRDVTKEQIHDLKLITMQLRRSVAPLREAIHQFIQSDHDLINDDTLPFLRDLLDHIVQTLDGIDTGRDQLSNLYDLYISEINFKMNNVMKVLTIVSTIFIPLTFLAGIYGMNFEYMPELHGKYSYYVLLGIMVVIAILLLGIFRRKRWL